MRQPSSLETSELVARVRLYSLRYAANRGKGTMFRNYAGLVAELLDRYDRDGMHTEYAPVLPNGLVLEGLVALEQSNAGMPLACREVTEWRYDDGNVV